MYGGHRENQDEDESNPDHMRNRCSAENQNQCNSKIGENAEACLAADTLQKKCQRVEKS